MKCPYCSNTESKVVDSRPSEDDLNIRRRRECIACAKRFTTYEVIENLPLVVIKKDNTRQHFDRDKLLSGLIRACVKRPVSIERLEQLVTEIEQTILNSLAREITTDALGELVLQSLAKIDEVAYIRFASVYKNFDDIQSFTNELKRIQRKEKL